MMQRRVLLPLLTAAAVAVSAASPKHCRASEEDAVSLLQVAPTPLPHSHMEWHVGKTWEASANNLGGTGPLSGAEELRFQNVSAFYADANTDDPGIMLDLLVQTASPYVNSNDPNKNGGHREFGAIQVDGLSGSVFRWTFVKMGTYEKVVIPDFVITFFDLDQQTNRPPCDENVTAWNAHSYAVVPDAYTEVTIEGLDRVLVCSNTPGSISNPRTVNGLSEDQKKASVMLAYQDTAEFLLSLRVNAPHKRKFQFSGPSADLLETAAWIQAHPTPSPTASPTASPTGMPTHSPTPSPTVAPTASPTGMPSHSPTPSPTVAPTASPTGMPTHSPTPSPTVAPTASPTGMPTHSPTPSPTVAPTPPTPNPTTSPTSTPTAAEPTAFGDPHVMNTAGEKFDIQRTGSHNFLSIPRGADAEHADLQVQGLVALRGDTCRGQRYITEMALTGNWLGAIRSMAFSTGTEEFNAAETIGLQVADSGNVSVDEFVRRVSPEMLELQRFHPERPSSLNRHVATLVAKVTLGPVKIKVTWVHTKEKTGFSNSLMLLAAGLAQVQSRIGGLLGEDSHKLVASLPPECFVGTAKQSFLQEPQRSGVRALALMDDAAGDNDEDDD